MGGHYFGKIENKYLENSEIVQSDNVPYTKVAFQKQKKRFRGA